MSGGDGPVCQIAVRPFRAGDVGAITALCGQLGYPSSEEQVGRRLESIARCGEAAVFVAAQTGGRVVGWVHVYVCRVPESDAQAEIGGLVVDADCRRSGVGRRLLEQVEVWARGQGCAVVSLRSNVVRQEAHVFYADLGYRQVKTQVTFRKEL